MGAPLGQRLGKTHWRLMNQLADKFYTALALRTSRLHYDSPLGDDWRAYKKAFVIFYLLDAKNSYYLNTQWQGSIQDERKRNMLRCAFLQDDHAFARYLQSLGVYLYAHNEQESLLHEARSAAVAQLFYSPNANYREGHTLLHSACDKQRQVDLVEFLFG